MGPVGLHPARSIGGGGGANIRYGESSGRGRKLRRALSLPTPTALGALGPPIGSTMKYLAHPHLTAAQMAGEFGLSLELARGQHRSESLRPIQRRLQRALLSLHDLGASGATTVPDPHGGQDGERHPSVSRGGATKSFSRRTKLRLVKTISPQARRINTFCGPVAYVNLNQNLPS
jgi:hypothetical protein